MIIREGKIFVDDVKEEGESKDGKIRFYNNPGSWKESPFPDFVAKREGLVMWESLCKLWADLSSRNQW